MLTFLLESEVLLEEAVAAPLQRGLRRWTYHGWRDPALFQLATYGLRFDPDHAGPEAYGALYRAMLNDRTVLPQPPATLTREPATDEGRLIPERPEMPPTSVGAVFESIRPIYAYFDSDTPLGDIFGIVSSVFRPQRTIRSGLGDVHLRAFPSGGARHPLEAYLVVKGTPDGQSGVYHYSSSADELIQVNGSGAASDIDKACFMKRGVQSSKIAVVITSRWIRHIWKYRYSRSYKMILMEAGHAIQALNLAAAAYGWEQYYCPSFDDEKVARICALSDPLEEGPLIVLTYGKNSISPEEYHDRFDVEPR